MKDRGDELSTADLAGQSAGSGGGATVADERSPREDAGQTGEGRTLPPADHPADDGAAVGGDLTGTPAMGDRDLPGDRAADLPGDADGADRAGFTDDRPGADFGDARADRADLPADRAGTGVGEGMTDRADHAGGLSGGGFADPADRADYAEPDRGELADAVAQRDAAAYADPPGAGVAGERVGGEAAGEMSPEPAPAPGGVSAGTGAGGGHEAGPLLPAAESEGFRARWTDVQTGFVDAPRRAVEQADSLVAELMQHLAKTFADERSQLEGQWDRGDDVPTDDLRTAFQRYRSFFERLLST